MSSGDSSSESVRAAGQPAGEGAGREERGLDQLWLLWRRNRVNKSGTRVWEGRRQNTEGRGCSPGVMWSFPNTGGGGWRARWPGWGWSQNCGCTDSAPRQRPPRPLWQGPHSTSHRPPSPGGPPAFSCTPAVPGSGEKYERLRRYEPGSPTKPSPRPG